MDKIEIVGLIVTILGVGCFSLIFTILYRAYTKSEIKDIQSGKKDIEIIDENIYDNLSHVKTRRKIMGTIKSVLFYGLMILIIPFFIFSIVNKIQGNVTMIGNRGVLVVGSGSMSKRNSANDYLFENNLTNQFNQFDLIVIERVESPWDLSKYDVISFVNDEGVNTIHRIIDINVNSDGDLEFTTKGDANGEGAIDKFKPTIDDIQGKYVGKKIPVIGMFILFLQSSLGMITVIALIYCLLMVDHLTSKINKQQKARLDMLNRAINLGDIKNKQDLKAAYVERLYYKGYAYLFNEDGFISKEEIKDEGVLKESNDKMIREIVNNENNAVVETNNIVIDSTEEAEASIDAIEEEESLEAEDSSQANTIDSGTLDNSTEVKEELNEDESEEK